MLRYSLIAFNVLLVTYLVWDSLAIIAVHQAEGTSHVFDYLIRGFVVSIPLITLASVTYPMKTRLAYSAVVFNSLMVIATFFGYYVVFFKGDYKLQAIYFLLLITLVFSLNAILALLLNKKNRRNS